MGLFIFVSQKWGTDHYSGAFIDFEIQCIKPMSQWSDHHVNSIREEGSFLNKKKYLTIAISKYKAESKFKVDYYGNFSFSNRLKRGGYQSYKVTEIENFEEEGSATLLRNPESFLSKETQLPLCD